MSHKHKPYSKNVEGDFYVEDGCCMTCMVTEIHAPNLMGFDEIENHCFVAKQPTDESEVFQAIKATWAAEVDCLRYRGQNPNILRRLAEAGASDSCDHKTLIQGIKPLLRSHVTFECAQIQSELETANQFKEYILNQNTEYLRYRVSKITSDNSGVTFSFSWYENDYYSVRFKKTELKDTWHIFHSLDYEKIGSRSVSLMIDEWLRNNKKANNIKWYSNTAWNKTLREGQETPF
jgi:hypothetical protein